MSLCVCVCVCVCVCMYVCFNQKIFNHEIKSGAEITDETAFFSTRRTGASGLPGVANTGGGGP